MTADKKKMTPRRRKNGARSGRDPREEINVMALIEALEQHVLGEKEMTATQVSAALALLKKTLPDMTEPSKKTIAATTPAAHEDALNALE